MTPRLTHVYRREIGRGRSSTATAITLPPTRARIGIVPLAGGIERVAWCDSSRRVTSAPDFELELFVLET
jgi:hypothetical protein